MPLILKPAYATYADYCMWRGLPNPTNVANYVEPAGVSADLRRARECVDSLLLLLVYPTDPVTKLPLNADLIQDLILANCIQYEYFLETGDIAAAGDYAGVKTQRPGPETVEFLRTQGYLGAAVTTLGVGYGIIGGHV